MEMNQHPKHPATDHDGTQVSAERKDERHSGQSQAARRKELERATVGTNQRSSPLPADYWDSLKCDKCPIPATHVCIDEITEINDEVHEHAALCDDCYIALFAGTVWIHQDPEW